MILSIFISFSTPSLPSEISLVYLPIKCLRVNGALITEDMQYETN